jgi:hypothetical protein
MRTVRRPGRAALAVTLTAAASLTLATLTAVAADRDDGKRPPRTPASTLGTALPARLPATQPKNTYYVDGAHGSDRNRGSRKAPWQTITKALAVVPLSGSVIEVLPGTYSSEGSDYALTFRRKGDTKNPVTVEAAVPGTVTIVNGDLAKPTTGAWIVHASGLRIRGLRFRLLTRQDSNVGANAVLIEDSDRIEITDCSFEEVASSGLLVRGGTGTTADDVWVINNVFRPSGTDPKLQVTGLGFTSDQYYGSKGSHWIYAGQYGNDSTWEQISGSRRLVIVNNVFTGTTAGRDIELGPQAQSSYVVDNTFYENQPPDAIGASTQAIYAGQAVQLFSNSSTRPYMTGFNVIANNVFANLYGNAVDGTGPAEPGNVVMHNLSWKVGLAQHAPNSQVFAVDESNRVDAPHFMKPRTFDFRLQPRSPALRSAAPQFTYPYDAGGRLRPAAPSIGAFESVCPSNGKSKGRSGKSSC